MVFMKMRELHKLAKELDKSVPLESDKGKSFKYPHYVVGAFYDRKTKERFIGIYKNGGELCKYFNVDGLNSDEITALTHEKIAALTEFDRTHYGTH